MLRRRTMPPYRVALVTGGARGIGRATATALLRAGLSVAIADRDEVTAAATARALGPLGTVRAYALDVTDLDAFEAVIARVERELGPVDVLVNNAGLMPVGPFLDQSPAADRLQIAVNLSGVIHGMRAALPGMRARGRGHVVNVASLAGRVGTPFAAVYAATKHAVIGLTEAVRAESEDTGVAFSYVLPVLVDTELIAGTGRPTWPPPLAPEQVADAIVGALRTGRVDVYVPRWTRLAQILPAVVPRPVYETVGRLFRIDRLFASVDAQARAAYVARTTGEGEVSEGRARGPG